MKSQAPADRTDRAHRHDPWCHTTHKTADLALGAFVRIAGPDAFTFVDSEERAFVGYTLRFPDAERSQLLEQARWWAIPAE